MPTYEYRCDACATNFDVVQSFHDDPVTECPTCGSPVKKVFGSVGIVFKGSGFYKTDNRSGSSRSATGGGSPDAATTGDAGTSTPATPPSGSGTAEATPSGSGASAAPASSPKPAKSGTPATSS